MNEKIPFIYIVLFLLSLLFTTMGYCEDSKVWLYYGNGMRNTEKQAWYSSDALKEKLNSSIQGTELAGKIEYRISHNPTGGFLEDFFESAGQLYDLTSSQIWRILAGLDIMPDDLQEEYKWIFAQIDRAMITDYESILEHVREYNKRLCDGDKVVVVAHSQGNLYANIAYTGIKENTIDGFGIVSVANPDWEVADNGPYTTIMEDQVIGMIPTALPRNLDNFDGNVNFFDWSGHNFIDSYLAQGRPAETKIINDVVETIDRLEWPEPCDLACYVKPKFNGHYAVRGGQTIKAEYVFEGTTKSMELDVFGTSNPPDYTSTDGLTQRIEIPNQEVAAFKETAAFYVKASDPEYYGMTPHGATFSHYYISDAGDYDKRVSVDGENVYLKRVPYKESDTDLESAVETYITFDEVEYPVFEVEFSDLKILQREPDEFTKQNRGTGCWAGEYIEMAYWPSFVAKTVYGPDFYSISFKNANSKINYSAQDPETGYLLYCMYTRLWSVTATRPNMDANERYIVSDETGENPTYTPYTFELEERFYADWGENADNLPGGTTGPYPIYRNWSWSYSAILTPAEAF